MVYTSGKLAAGKERQLSIREATGDDRHDRGEE
jgi:hypothetical protein